MGLENVADLNEWSKNFSPDQIFSGNLEALQALFYLTHFKREIPKL